MIELKKGEHTNYGEIYDIEEERENELLKQLEDKIEVFIISNEKGDEFTSEDVIHELFGVAQTEAEQCYVSLHSGMKIMEMQMTQESARRKNLLRILNEEL